MNIHLPSLGPLLAVLLVSPVAGANVVGVDTQNFNPTTNGLDFVTVQSSETLSPGFLNLGLFVNYARNTLPVFSSQAADDGGSETRDALTSLDFSIGYGVTSFLDLGLSFPYLLNQSVQSDQFRGQFGQTGATEIRGNLKLKLFGSREGGMALIVSSNYNRVSNNPFLGSGYDPTYNFELAADTTVSAVALGVNVGYRSRGPGEKLEDFPIAPFEDQYIGSLAASFLFAAIDTKLIGEVWLSKPVRKADTIAADRLQSSQDSIVGLKFDASTDVAIHTGVGREINHSQASPDLRVYAGLNWVFGPKPKPAIKKAQIRRAKVPAPPPPKDEEPLVVAEEKADEVFVLNDINFAYDSDIQVLAGAKLELHKLAQHVSARTLDKIIIEGHTDSIATAEYNYDLGLRRAEAIKRHLLRFESVPAEKLEVRSLGETEPVADNGNAQGRQLNRRVVFKVFYADEPAVEKKPPAPATSQPRKIPPKAN